MLLPSQRLFSLLRSEIMTTLQLSDSPSLCLIHLEEDLIFRLAGSAVKSTLLGWQMGWVCHWGI